MEAGTELAVGGQALLERPIYDQIDSRKLQVIKSTVAKGASDTELAMFLELAARLDLSPFTGEIWCAKSPGRDGREGKLLIMVGRDGLLKNAERYPDYRGYDSGVVREGDYFERVGPDPAAPTLRGRAGVVHREAHPKEAGEILGAWCVAERQNRPPRYFYAPLSEYMPEFDADWKLKKSPWGNQVSAMIEKVPISVTHRTLCGITGVYLQEEVDRMLQPVEATAAAPDPLESIEDEDARDTAREALATIHGAHPDAWPDAKLEMMLKGANMNRQHEVAAMLAREAAAATPPDADVVDDTIVEPPKQQPAEPDGDAAVLRLRAGLLEDRAKEAATEEERAAVLEELDGVEARLREQEANDNPGQDSLL